MLSTSALVQSTGNVILSVLEIWCSPVRHFLFRAICCKLRQIGINIYMALTYTIKQSMPYPEQIDRRTYLRSLFAVPQNPLTFFDLIQIGEFNAIRGGAGLTCARRRYSKQKGISPSPPLMSAPSGKSDELATCKKEKNCDIAPTTHLRFASAR
jgi:hypothetical protein